MKLETCSLKPQMRAVYIREFGGVENLEIREVPDPPEPGGPQVIVRVKAAGLNRADLVQRRGFYPPPAEYSPNIPGLEFAGEVTKVGAEVRNFQPGDHVFGIMAGEAQAEFVLTDEKQLTRIPDNLSFVEAGAIPETFFTAYDAVFLQAGLEPGQTLLVHAAGSGVGLAAVQLAKANGATVIGTSRTAEKLERCREFGLDHAIVVTDPKNFADEVKSLTDGFGVDVILDLVGGAYFPENLRSLAVKGTLMLVGLTAGAKAEFDLGLALKKRATITGTTLRVRPLNEKAKLTREFENNVVPLLLSGAVKANVDRVFPFEQVREAHEYLESNESFGKVVLEF